MLYKEACQRVCRTGVLVHMDSNHLLPTGFIKGLEEQFERLFEVFISRPILSSAKVHQEKLWEHREDWITIRSDETCFACMLRRPQYRLQCGHLVCDTSVRVLGSTSIPWTFQVERCFLCQLDTLEFSMRIKPPTASVRLLTIDGGGTRGVVPLVFLQALEERIGLPYPVQENFDLAFGTSIGKSNLEVPLQLLTES